MIAPRHPGSFLLTQFREFYGEVARFKRTVAYAPLSAAEEEAIGVEAVAGSAEGGHGTAVARATETSPMVLQVWQDLLTLLERQEQEAGQGGAFAYEVYREAEYVMAALADEVFLHLEWEGKSSWPLLESRIFQSHIAGEEVFNRIDRLLQRRDPFYLDLAAIYFTALSLGFEGKYRGTDDPRRRDYRLQLFRMIYRREPKLYAAVAPLFPETYKYTLDKSEVKRLPAQWIWMWLVAAVLVLWVVLSQYTWAAATNRVSCLVCHVLDPTKCTCTVGAGK